MSNNFFKFKQFIVEQDKCAMKVTTDSCLFGSIVANAIKNTALKIENCLDVGTGTGLLSLMIAQKNNQLKIDAIEIDEQAAMQAALNFRQSPFGNQLQIICGDARKFLFNKKYNFIFSNPPFFEDDLKSVDVKKNIALHGSELNLEELLQIIKNNLAFGGMFAILLPNHRSDYFEELCLKEYFYCNKKILVKQTPKHDYFRDILFFSTKNISSLQEEIVIQNNHQYTKEFIELLKDYYLHL